MADLGSIQYTDVNSGTSRVDRSQEVDALSNFLQAGRQIANEGIKAKVTGDLTEAINPSDQGEVPGADAEQHTVPIERAGSGQTIYPEGSAEAALSTEMDRLNAVISQGSQSQAKLAEMRIKQVLVDAQNKFPWLHSDLQARASTVMASNVKLDQLALADAAASEEADLASKQKQKILDEAYDLWEDGGLGMPRWVTPDDPQFLPMYIDRRRDRNTLQSAAIEEGLFLGNQSLAAKDKAGKVLEDITGRNSYTRAATNRIFDDYQMGELLTELGKGDSADFNKINTIRSSTLPQGIAALRAEKASLMTHFNQNVNPQFRDTVYFKSVKAAQDDVLEELDMYITAFEGVLSDTPNATDFVREMTLIRGADFGRLLPTPLQDLSAFAQTAGGEFVLGMVNSDKTASGLSLMNEYANAYTSSMSQMYPDFFGPAPNKANMNALLYRTSGALHVGPQTSPEDINKTIRQHQRQSNEPFMVRTFGIDDEIDVSTKTAAMWLESWGNNLEGIPPSAAPQAAGHYLTGLNYSLAHQVDLGETREEPVEILMKGLASEGLRNALDVTQVDNANQRIAFARTAKSWYVDQAKPTKRRQEVAMRYQAARVGGTPLSDLVTVDLDATNGAEGSFQYEVDSAKLQELAKSRMSIDKSSNPRSSKPLAVYYNELEGEVFDFMEEVSREVETQINIERNLRRASAPAGNVDPNIDNFQAYYSGMIEPGIQTPWIDIFKHKESN